MVPPYFEQIDVSAEKCKATAWGANGRETKLERGRRQSGIYFRIGTEGTPPAIRNFADRLVF
jgi:hypothetical protein